MAGFLPRPRSTGPSPIDEPRRDSAVRLPLRTTVIELVLGAVVATVVSMVLQFAVARLSISEPSYAPEALASVGAAVVLVLLFGLLTFGRRQTPRWLRLGGTWVALSAFTTIALATLLQATRFYFGGSSTDNAFRMQYLTRMASSPALADMNYADTAPYYPAGWFWLGGRFANLLGWEGWAAYKPYALAWIAVTAVVTFTLWSVVIRRRLALLAALATTLAGLLHGIEEPYAWPSAAWLVPVAVLAWHALRREWRAPRWTLVCVGAYLGFAAITYTLHFAFAVLLIVTMAVVLGILKVHNGQSAKTVVSRLFLRLVPIGATSAVIALLVWLPYLLSTHFLLSTPRSAAFHYLPQSGAYLPVPMAEASPFGMLCLAGLLWMLMRARRSEVAAAMLVIVLTVYCWFVLSTAMLVLKTTLLAFRLDVVLGATLATAGVLGLLELVGVLRHKLDRRHATQISLISCVLGLLGAITLTQGGLGTALAPSVDKAYADYYPSGYTAGGQRDPDAVDAWTAELNQAIDATSRRAPEDNILLSTDYKLMSFRPYWGFQQETPHYANPLGEYDARAEEIKRWTTARTSDELVGMLDHSPFTPPNVFVFRSPGAEVGTQTGPRSETDRPEQPEAETKFALNLKDDAFPQVANVRDYDVHFDPAAFNSPEFVWREVGPYTVIARR